MTIAEALTLRAGFANIKRQLAESGVDVSDVKSVNDLPGIVASMLPDKLVPELEKNLLIPMENENLLERLLIAFANDARVGALVQDMVLGTDVVSEEDLNG